MSWVTDDRDVATTDEYRRLQFQAYVRSGGRIGGYR
jgi:hypothetical protein